MKRFAIVTALGLGVSILAGCNKVAHEVEQGARGVEEHALSKVVGSATDKADSQVNKGTDAITGDNQSKDRNALSGNDSDTDKDK